MGSGTFHCWNTAFERLPDIGGRVLVAAHEWGDNVAWLRRMAKRMRIDIDVVPGTDGQSLDPKAWAKRMDDDVIALCLPLVTSIKGLRYPAEEISAIERPNEALVFLDAAQALGRIRVCPESLGCDVLVGTGRKWLRGPRQTAMYWLSDRAQKVLAVDAREIEPFDLNAALLAGLQTALEHNLNCAISTTEREISCLDGALRTILKACNAIEVLPPQTIGTVCCGVPRNLRPKLERAFAENCIVAKWCNPTLNEPLSCESSSVEYLRLSPHIYNDASEIRVVAETIVLAEQSKLNDN